MTDTPAPRSFSTRLPLARAALDRDHLTRAGGIDALLDDARTRAIVLHEGRALLATPTRLAILPPSIVPQAALAVYLGRTLEAARDWVEHTDEPNARLIAATRERADLVLTL